MLASSVMKGMVFKRAVEGESTSRKYELGYCPNGIGHDRIEDWPNFWLTNIAASVDLHVLRDFKHQNEWFSAANWLSPPLILGCPPPPPEFWHRTFAPS